MVEPAGCDRVVRVALGWTGQEAYPTALTMPTRSQPVRLQERPHYLRELVRPVYLRKVTGPLDDTELRVREGLGIEAARRCRLQVVAAVNHQLHLPGVGRPLRRRNQRRAQIAAGTHVAGLGHRLRSEE